MILGYRATKVTHSVYDFGIQSDKNHLPIKSLNNPKQKEILARDKSHPERQKSLTNKEPKASPKHQTYPVTRNRNQFDKNAIERQTSLTNKEPKQPQTEGAFGPQSDKSHPLSV